MGDMTFEEVTTALNEERISGVTASMTGESHTSHEFLHEGGIEL
jgi:hypothetical protein